MPVSEMITGYGHGVIGMPLVHTEASSIERRLFKEQKNNQGLYSSAYTEPAINMH